MKIFWWSILEKPTFVQQFLCSSAFSLSIHLLKTNAAQKFPFFMPENNIISWWTWKAISTRKKTLLQKMFRDGILNVPSLDLDTFLCSQFSDTHYV